jgi:hypothetical protein
VNLRAPVRYQNPSGGPQDTVLLTEWATCSLLPPRDTRSEHCAATSLCLWAGTCFCPVRTPTSRGYFGPNYPTEFALFLRPRDTSWPVILGLLFSALEKSLSCFGREISFYYLLIALLFEHVCLLPIWVWSKREKGMGMVGS